MNKKACFTWIIVALIIGASIAAHGYFYSQMGVYLNREQEAAFLRAVERKVLEPGG